MSSIPETSAAETRTRLLCNRCGAPAQAHTPFGFMCESHALREMLEAHERGEKDWVPFSLPHRPS
jgi:hypothetical protein